MEKLVSVYKMLKIQSCGVREKFLLPTVMSTLNLN